MKLSKRIIVAVLAMGLVVGSLAAVPADSSAKAKLNKKKITIKVGKTFKLKVKGAKGKVKWSSAKKSIAKVSKKGVVKGVKAGATKITAKVGKNKLTCKVTVKPAGDIVTNVVVVPTIAPTAVPTVVPTATPPVISNSELASKMAVKFEKLPSGKVMLSVTNNNTVDIKRVSISYVLKTTDDVVIKTSSVDFRGVSVGSTQYETISLYENTALLDITKCVASVVVENNAAYTVPVKEGVTVTASKTLENGVSITATNSLNVPVYGDSYVFFKDAAGNVLDVKSVYLSLKEGATAFEDVSSPYYVADTETAKAYEDIEYSDIQVITCLYKWEY